MVQAHHQHLFFMSMQPHVDQSVGWLGSSGADRHGHRFARRLEALRQANMVGNLAGRTIPCITPSSKYFKPT